MSDIAIKIRNYPNSFAKPADVVKFLSSYSVRKTDKTEFISPPVKGVPFQFGGISGVPIYYNAEEEIAFRIKRLQKAKNMKKIASIEKEIKKVEKESSIELSDKQREAVKLVNENNVVIITGGPGTGKTTIIKTIIDIYEERGKKVVLAAPTRKSSKKNDRNYK